ncbi:DUF2147 domain-containing protein [Aquimarina sp. RZ0]|uniref:DUF2147 domain-containing protein n=1 Tax=Aquimarina sp. RZ0 TaxID=2607730 RepID=UPI0011F35A45|nr:DUF2147 domain-containing protein [Aquimarina sp. RZ0]KAA1246880.1 DUF2147 domain-containing protein [Aquimarina sp. RZ0]
MKIIFSFLLLLLHISDNAPRSFIGQWQIEGGSIIEIYKKREVFYGKILKRAQNPISNLNGLDNKNPAAKLRNRPLLGLVILDKLMFIDGELSGGTIYNADSGKTYAVKLWIDDDDPDLCYIRAYKGILFKTFEAHRVR